MTQRRLAVAVTAALTCLPDPSEYQWRVEITSDDPVNDPGQGGQPIHVDLQVFASSDWNECQTDTLSTGSHRMQVSSCLEMGANGNVNCDANVTSADVLHLVSYVFKSGLAPCDICQSSPLVCEP